MNRPIGVTIIAVLAIIAGIVTLLGSLPYFGVSFMSSVLGGTGIATLATGLGVGIGITVLIVGILQLAFGIGSLSMRSWAWTLGVVLFALSLVAYLGSMLVVGFTMTNVVGALLAAVIIGYLYSTEVRSAFGHAPHRGAHTGTPSMTS
jgi:hypothetical protein